MSYFDHDETEWTKVVGFAVAALCALALPGFVTGLLGFEGFWRWLAGLPVLVRYPVIAIIWGASWVVVSGVGKGLLGFLENAFASAANAIDGIASVISRLLTRCLEISASGTRHLFTLAIWPARLVLELALDRIQPQLLLMRQKWEEERELRRLYREEFRNEFRSFREFRRHFENAGAEKEKPRQEEAQRERQKPDPFAAACRLLGLPESGSFTAAELKDRYRTLMKSLHPDVAGPNELATQVNAACTMIRERKGWS